MTATAQGTQLRCDREGCNATATVEQDAWMFCSDHAGTPTASAPTPSRPTVTLPSTPAPAQPSRPMPQVAGGGTIGLLLEQASAHSSKRVRNLAEKIEGQVDQLRTLVTQLADAEKAKQAELAAKAAAKAEVARLEQQLAAARAKLRNKPTPEPGAASRRPPQSTGACLDCSAAITRAPGQRGALPTRCADCKAKRS